MINYIENVFNVAYSYVSSFLWQAANLLGISLETLLYSLAAALVIGMFFLKRSAKETAPISDNANEQETNENLSNLESWEEWNQQEINYYTLPSYDYMPENIYNKHNQ